MPNFLDLQLGVSQKVKAIEDLTEVSM